MHTVTLLLLAALAAGVGASQRGGGSHSGSGAYQQKLVEKTDKQSQPKDESAKLRENNTTMGWKRLAIFFEVILSFPTSRTTFDDHLVDIIPTRKVITKLSME